MHSFGVAKISGTPISLDIPDNVSVKTNLVRAWCTGWSQLVKRKYYAERYRKMV